MICLSVRLITYFINEILWINRLIFSLRSLLTGPKSPLCPNLTSRLPCRASVTFINGLSASNHHKKKEKKMKEKIASGPFADLIRFQ